MSVDNDAREFGQHFKQGGWRLGLLVGLVSYECSLWSLSPDSG